MIQSKVELEVLKQYNEEIGNSLSNRLKFEPDLISKEYAGKLSKMSLFSLFKQFQAIYSLFK